MSKSRAPKKLGKAAIRAAADRAEKRANGEEPILAKVEIDPVIVKEADTSEGGETRMGRPPKYRPEFARIAAALCRRGATDFELAEEFEVSTVTIWRWQSQHEEFCKALTVEKNSYDDRVKRSLAQRAVGYSYHTEKVFQFQGSIVRAKVVEHVPADIGAAKLWLTNRRPEEFRDLSKVEHGGPGDFDRMTDDELEKHIKSEAKALLGESGSGRSVSKTKH
jgi:hypothetical protein